MKSSAGEGLEGGGAPRTFPLAPYPPPSRSSRSAYPSEDLNVADSIDSGAVLTCRTLGAPCRFEEMRGWVPAVVLSLERRRAGDRGKRSVHVIEQAFSLMTFLGEW